MSIVVEILESFLGKTRGHNHASGQMQFDCPACSQEQGMPEGNGKANLEVNYNKGYFHCWVCGDTNRMKGRLPYLIKRFADQKTLRDFYLVKPEFKEVNKLGETSLIKLPESFKLLSEASPRDYKYGEAMAYLNKRRISADQIRKLRLGFCSQGKYANRIIIPSYDTNNELNFFVGRSFNNKTKPKVLNEEAEKSIIVFNEGLINWDATIYLVEGPFDHIVTPNSIPLLGKYVSDYLFFLLHTKAKANIVILLDGDAFDDTKELYRKLNVGNLRNRVKVIELTRKFDPSLVNEKLGITGMIKILSSTKRIPESQL